MDADRAIRVRSCGAVPTDQPAMGASLVSSRFRPPLEGNRLH